MNGTCTKIQSPHGLWSWRKNSTVRARCELWPLCVFHWRNIMHVDCSGPTGGAEPLCAVLLHAVQFDTGKPEDAFQSWAWVGDAAWYRGDSHGAKWHGALCPLLMRFGPTAGAQDPGRMSPPGRSQHTTLVSRLLRKGCLRTPSGVDILSPTANTSYPFFKPVNVIDDKWYWYIHCKIINILAYVGGGATLISV